MSDTVFSTYNGIRTKPDITLIIGLFSALTIICIYTTISFTHISNRTIPYSTFNHSKIAVGPATQKLIVNITALGLEPVALKSINRNFFTVPGTLVTLKGDNITIFEYPDNATAVVELSALQQSEIVKYRSWKRLVHIYISENVIVFYAGARPDIISSLENILGQAVPTNKKTTS